MITALILDADAKGASTLANILKSNYSELIKVVGTYSTLKDSKSKINDLKPNLVFLDQKLEDSDAETLLGELKRTLFSLVITARDTTEAFKAFEWGAIDFLVKPYKEERIALAIERAKNIVELQNATPIVSKKIGLPTNKGILFFEPKEILYCEADNNYTDIVFQSGEKENICRTLKEVESVLSKNFNFVRIHKSYIINIEKVSKYIKADGGYLLLEKCKDMLPISKTHKETLHKYLNML